MGAIKDGTVSGFLPNTKAFAVHHPGYPSSMSRAIDSLGGPEAILRVHSSHLNRLELRFRPEDPYSHPVYGELQPCNNLLLKISKKKSVNMCGSGMSNGSTTGLSEGPSICSSESADNGHLTNQHVNKSLSACGKDEAANLENVQAEVSADIVARVLDAYHFNGMVDYQYVLPVHANAERTKKRSWMEEAPPSGQGDLKNMYHEDLLILLPQLFSPKDVPEKVVLKPPFLASSKNKQERVVQQRWEMDIEPCFAIDFNTEVIPKKVNWEDYIPQGSYHWELQVAVSKLFEERPVWPKAALCERLLDQRPKVGDYMLRRLLFRAAYYFSNGPFQRFWIRKGYDPRQDAKSCMYQRIDFRVPKDLQDYCVVNTAKGLKQRWKDICEFRVFPYKCHTNLQLFELSDEYIQEEIRKPLKQKACTCETGWFSYAVLESLKLCVKVRFLSVYPESDGEALLKSYAARFEMSKRMQFHKFNLRPGKDVNQHVGKAEAVIGEDKEDTDLVDDAMEDEVGADDAMEDEVGFDDALEDEVGASDAMEDEVGVDDDDEEESDEAGEDSENSLRTRTYIDDNASRNYLQELFGNFPTNQVTSGSVQDIEASDGEYEIYGQYSDGNYSDEED